MIRLYLAEDQVMLNSTLTQLLNLEEDLTVIGSAQSGDVAFNDLCHLTPDVAILDIEMPGLTGLQVAKKLKEAKLPIKVIILTTFARQEYFEAAVETEVAGYLLKDSPAQTLISAIHAIYRGETIYSSELVRHVLRTEKNPLTEREIALLKSIAQGLTTQRIAEENFLTAGTVRNYISSILSKTGAQSRIEAVNIAQKNHWL